MSLITRDQMMKFAPHGTAIIAAAIADNADRVLPKWKINTGPRLWMFMAMADVESAHFAKLFESLNYSVEGLLATFPTHFTAATAAQYGRTATRPADQRMIANIAYGDRMGNRGSTTDDGWLCRGQGLMGTTGRDSFERLAKALCVAVDQCRAMLTADDTLLECAVATFVAWGCLPYADKGDVEGCTRIINGGLNGLADRQAAYALAKRVWPSLSLDGPAVAAIRPAPPIPSPGPIEPPAAAPVHIDKVIAAAQPTGFKAWFANTFFRRPS